MAVTVGRTKVTSATAEFPTISHHSAEDTSAVEVPEGDPSVMRGDHGPQRGTPGRRRRHGSRKLPQESGESDSPPAGLCVPPHGRSPRLGTPGCRAGAGLDPVGVSETSFLRSLERVSRSRFACWLR